MLKPYNFSDWKYWVLHEWYEWNPYRLYRKVFCFAANILAYRNILWHDQDCDYAYLLILMEFKLYRMGQYFANNGILVDSPRTSRECLVASELCRRINKEDYIIGQITRESIMRGGNQRQADLNYLTHLMQRKLFTWWD